MTGCIGRIRWVRVAEDSNAVVERLFFMQGILGFMCIVVATTTQYLMSFWEVGASDETVD